MLSKFLYTHFLVSIAFPDVLSTLPLFLRVLRWAVSVYGVQWEHYGMSLASGVLCWEGYDVHQDIRFLFLYARAVWGYFYV